MTNIRRNRSPLAFALLGAGVLLAAACDTNKLLQVDDPAVATPASLSDPSTLVTQYNGVLGDFQVAYSGSSDGNNEGINTTTGVMTDELKQSDTFTTRIATDQRNQQPVQNGNTSDGAYNNLHRARHSAKVTALALAKVDPADPRIAVVKALEGATYVALGENYCGYIPFSDVKEGAFEPTPKDIIYGEPLTQAQVFDSAVVRFDAALAVDATNNLAKVLKGRALLDNGDFVGAAGAVATVPDAYVYYVEHSKDTGRQYNPMYSLAASNGRYTVADGEGVNGLRFMSALDPRIPWAANKTINPSGSSAGFDKSTPLFLDLRYPDYGSQMPLASGVEARLIEAEAALHAGDVNAWLAKLNYLRDSFPKLIVKLVPDWGNQVAKTTIAARTLAPLADPGTGLAAADAAIARQNLMFSERAFWLYTTGHRLGDLRRLVRQYSRTQDQVFPTGAFAKGGNYGTDVAFPVPFNERQNPKYDPSQCNVKSAS